MLRPNGMSLRRPGMFTTVPRRAGVAHQQPQTHSGAEAAFKYPRPAAAQEDLMVQTFV
jgi:hypothetical protein